MFFSYLIPRQSLLRSKRESYFMYYPPRCQEFIKRFEILQNGAATSQNGAATAQNRAATAQNRAATVKER